MSQSDEPFFLMVNFPDPHWPFKDVVEGRPVHPVEAKDVVSFPYIGFDNERIRKYTTGIYNGLLRLDECVGELMDKLKQSGKERNTLVIFLSDHGDEMARGKFDITKQQPGSRSWSHGRVPFPGEPGQMPWFPLLTLPPPYWMRPD